MSEFSSSDDEGGPILPVSREPDDQLFADVQAFAAGLGFSSKGAGKAGMASTDDPAFDDFAPEKAKKKLEKQPNNTLSKEGKNDANTKSNHEVDDEDGQDGAAAAATAPPLKARPEDPPRFTFDPIPEFSKTGAPARSLLKNGDAGRWYENTVSLTTKDGEKSNLEKDVKAIDTKRQRGLHLLSAEAAAFEASAARQKGGSNLQWLQQAQRGGTTSDKVAAMTLLVQEAPVANLRSLDALINMAAKRGGARAVVGTALDALKELWLEVLLPPERKLIFFDQQPLALVTPGKEGDTALVLWTFEDALKKRYAVFVDHLDHLSRDNLEFVKDRASKTAYDLLAARPEAESALLSTLVNKLGDPSRKLASKVGYLLTTLLAAHPGMKAVVVREVERFAFRPGLADRARYYAVVFLNQMVLTHKDAPIAGVSLARRLVDVYFTLFKLVMEGKVGTAASLAAAKREKVKKEAEARAAKRGKKKASAQKKKKNNNNGDNSEDEDGEKEEDIQGQQHNGEMDARMLSALITGVRRAFPFVAAEEVEPLIEAHADALFRLTHNVGSLGVATQALLLLHQLMSSRNSISDRFYRALYAVLASPELTRSTKAPMFLALLFKALKADVSPRRVAAFAKRLLQVASEAPSNFACGCLMLLSELLKTRPGLWNAVLQGEERESDAVEKFVDAEDGQGEEKKRNKNEKNKKKNSNEEDEDFAIVPVSSPSTSLKNSNNTTTSAITTTNPTWPPPGSYDMRKREPQFANAERSCFWELLPLASHAHPSVAAMARTLLAGAHVSYDGDPLQDLTLHAFLDKFIQKKAKIAARGDSLMQPLRAPASNGIDGGASAGGIVPLSGNAGAAAVGAAFSELDTRDVAPDDAFFYKFYSLQAANGGPGSKKKKKKSAGGDDEDLVSDEDGEGSDDEDAMDDFLAGEEDGGDDGMSVDPDAAVLVEYDYSELEAAMEEEDDVSGGEESEEDDGSDSGSEDEVLDGEEEGEDVSDSEEEDGGKGKSRKGAVTAAVAAAKNINKKLASSSDSDDEESLDGAEFSDLSEGSASENDDDLSENEDIFSSSEEEEEDSGEESDDGAADAEIAELLSKMKKKQQEEAKEKAKNKKKRKKGDESESDDEIPDDLNPFELPEATDSEGEEEEEEEEAEKDAGDALGSGSSEDEEEDLEDDDSESDDEDDGDEDLILDEDLSSDSDEDDDDDGAGGGGGGGSVKRKNKDKPIFASADDYDDLIVRDLQGEVDEEEDEKAKARAGYRNKQSGRGRGRGGGGGARGRGRGRGGRSSAGPDASKRQKR